MVESASDSALLLLCCSFPVVTFCWSLLFTIQFRSVQFSHSVLSESFRPHGLQHACLPCPSPTPRAYSNSCPLSQWCHPATWPSSCTSPAAFNLSWNQVSEMSQFCVSGAQSIRVSASVSVLPKPCRKSPSGKQLFFVLILIHSCFGKVTFVTQILGSECLGSHSVMSDSLWPHGL